MKQYLIGIILLTAFLLSNCSKTKQDNFEKIINLLPKNDLPEILEDYLNNSNSIELSHPFDSTKLLLLEKNKGASKQKVYVILHNPDTLENSYITIVEHKIFDSIVCCNPFLLSDYSVKTYQLIDTFLQNKTTEVFPKDKKSYELFYPNVDFWKNRGTCNIMVPFVYPDSIVIKNVTNPAKTYKFIWDNNGYIFSNYNTYSCESFDRCTNSYIDKDFIDFYKTFANAILSNDTIKLKQLTYFPLKVHESYYSDEIPDYLDEGMEDYEYRVKVNKIIVDTIRYEYNLDEFYSTSIIAEWGENSIFQMGEIYESLYTGTIGLDSAICPFSLKYEGGAFPVIDYTISFVFTKVCNEYKFSGYIIKPMPIGGT